MLYTTYLNTMALLPKRDGGGQTPDPCTNNQYLETSGRFPS